MREMVNVTETREFFTPDEARYPGHYYAGYNRDRNAIALVVESERDGGYNIIRLGDNPYIVNAMTVFGLDETLIHMQVHGRYTVYEFNDLAEFAHWLTEIRKRQ